MDTKLSKWMKWLKIIHDDVQQLLVKRRIFWEVQEIIRTSGDLHNKPSSFYGYLGDTYVAYIAIGIRRQIKCDSQSVSFARLLHEIQETPAVLSRKYYVGLYAGSAVEDLADVDFDSFSGVVKDHIDPGIVAADLSRLVSVSKKIEDFVDKQIAHRDKRIPKIVPTFKEVNECVDVLDELYTKYHRAFYAQDMRTLDPVPQYDWKAIFRVPWIK